MAEYRSREGTTASLFPRPRLVVSLRKPSVYLSYKAKYNRDPSRCGVHNNIDIHSAPQENVQVDLPPPPQPLLASAVGVLPYFTEP